MDLLRALFVSSVLICLVLAFLVYKSDSKNNSNKVFALLVLSVAIWVSSNYFANFPNFNPLLTTRLTFVGSSLVGLFLLLFSYYFPKKERFSTVSFWAPIIITLAIIILIFTKLIVAGTTIIPSGTGVQQGNLFFLYIIYFVCFASLCIINLIKKYLKYDGVEKSQLRYILWGLGITLIIAVLTNLLIPFLLNSDTLINYGPYAVFIFIGFTFFAIVRHHLLDIRVILTEAATAIVVIAVFIQLLLSKNASDRIVNFGILVLVSYGGYILIKSVVHEIGQREKLEELTTELQNANVKLKQVDAMKTEFISMASHELLTPISAIEGYLSMMLDEHLVKIDDPKAIQYMQSVYKSSKRLARLVADLLNVSRIEQGRMMVLKKETDLATLIDEVVKELKFKVEEKKHKLLTSIRQNIDTHIYADEDKIKEVIINLTGNSIKYTKDGGLIGIGVDVWPTSEVEKRFGIMHNELKEHGKTAEGALLNIVDPHFAQLVGDKQLVIIVKDNGIGITHEDMGRLFQKFSRVGDWSTQEVQGTGLGLYISRALVEMHHGRIWVESKGEGKGCTFYFSLPLIKVEDEEKKLDAEVPIAADAKPLAKSGS